MDSRLNTAAQKVSVLDLTSQKLYSLNDTHLVTYQAARALFDTSYQSLPFKPNYNQLS